jgi:hypothetical protein
MKRPIGANAGRDKCAANCEYRRRAARGEPFGTALMRANEFGVDGLWWISERYK